MYKKQMSKSTKQTPAFDNIACRPTYLKVFRAGLTNHERKPQYQAANRKEQGKGIVPDLTQDNTQNDGIEDNVEDLFECAINLG